MRHVLNIFRSFTVLVTRQFHMLNYNTEIKTYTFTEIGLKTYSHWVAEPSRGHSTQIYLLDLHMKVVGTDIKSYKQTCKIIFQSAEKGMVFVTGLYDLNWKSIKKHVRWWARFHFIYIITTLKNHHRKLACRFSTT